MFTSELPCFAQVQSAYDLERLLLDQLTDDVGAAHQAATGLVVGEEVLDFTEQLTRRSRSGALEYGSRLGWEHHVRPTTA